MDSETRLASGSESAAVRRSSSNPLSGPGGALVGLGVALPLTVALWGFSVDDAFIPARVAAHLLQGHGATFNAAGPVTDAVTPLGFAHGLAGLAHFFASEPTVVGVLEVARRAGGVAWLCAAALLGYDLSRLPGIRWRELLVAWLALGSCVPFAAWAGSGLETPWVVLLATWALRRRPGADFAAGWAAAWRPELIPWAATLVLVRTLAGSRTRREGSWVIVLVSWASVVGPSVIVAVVRWSLFGRLTPLSFLAKAPDLAHGVRYALGAWVLAGPFWLLVSRSTLPWARSSSDAAALLSSIGAHVLALMGAGGDWMPFFRLATPVLPAVIVAGAELAVFRRTSVRSVSAWGGALRVVLLLSAGTLLVIVRAADARRVMERRTALVMEGAGQLADKQRIAAVDVGWIGAASTADIVDLAGVTDPKIAALPGGHTTKRVAPGLLGDREVDTLVFLAQRGQSAELWYRAPFIYGVEARLAPPAFTMGYRLVGRIPLPGTDWEYLVCTWKPTSLESATP